MVKAKRKRVSKVVPSRNPEKNVKLTADTYLDPETNLFKPGNPGRPVGTENYRTRFAREFLSCFSTKVRNRYQRLLEQGSNTMLLKGLDRAIQVYGSGRATDSVASEMPPFVLHIEGHGVVNETKTKPGESIP